MDFAIRKIGAPQVIDLQDFPLEKEDIEWLKKALPRKPTIDDVNALANRLSKAAPRDDAERRRLRVLIGVQESLKGNYVARSDRAVNATGRVKLGDLHVLALSGARPVNGESEKMRAVKESMEAFLVGQQKYATLDNRQAFADFYAATQAPGRRVPPVMVLMGPDGHGKAQAVDGFADSAASGVVHHVDLYGKQDKDFGGIFAAPGGPLTVEVLQGIAEQGGVVWITGLESLNAPMIAHGLAQLITAQRGTGSHVKVPYFLDYTVEPEKMAEDSRGHAKELLAKTLDKHGLRSKAAQAYFDRLTPEAMLVYADAVLAQVLKSEGLSNLHLTFDPDAREFLGKLLATPHAPLNELEARLRELIVRHIDTQTSVYRNGGFLRITLGKSLQNIDLQNALIARFHEKHVDLDEGHAAFEPLETGRHVDSEGLAQELIANASRFAHLVRRLGDLLMNGPSLQLARNIAQASRDVGIALDETAAALAVRASGGEAAPKAGMTSYILPRLEAAASAFGQATTEILHDPLLVSRDKPQVASNMREQIHLVIDLLHRARSLSAPQLSEAAALATAFAQAFTTLSDEISSAAPERRLANLRAGLEALGAVVDMAAQAANDNAQHKQIDIIRRDDAKVCRQALEEARQILVGFSLESSLQFRPLVDGFRSAGYEDRVPLLVQFVTVARDLVDSMQGEEDVTARSRSELAIDALRDVLSDALAAANAREANPAQTENSNAGQEW